MSIRASEVSKTSMELKTLYGAPPCISKLIEGSFSSSVLQTTKQQTQKYSFLSQMYVVYAR